MKLVDADRFCVDIQMNLDLTLKIMQYLFYRIIDIIKV